MTVEKTRYIHYSRHEVMRYWWALVLLGIGWSFLFVGSTALLVDAYHRSNATRRKQ